MIRRFLIALALVALAVPASAEVVTVAAGKTGSIYSGGSVLTLTNDGNKPGSATVSCKSGAKGKTYKLPPRGYEGFQQTVDAVMEATCKVTAGPTDIKVSNE